MRATDRRTTAAVPGDPDDPDPDVARAALLADTGLDRALAGRLREESRRTRVRVERHLVTSGHLGEDGTPRPSGPEGDVPTAVDDVDAWRDLGEMLDEHVELLDRIDALHERRLRSHSARERQASTRVLAEALHRIVDGYGVEVAEPPGVMAAGQRADAWLGRALGRLAATARRPAPALRWWARNGRWVRLGLALVAGAALGTGALAAGAAVVAVRCVLATVLFSHLPDARPGRILGYDPAWAACVCTHLGDAAVLAGLGLGLHLHGHSGWGAATAFAALFSLLATMLRVASGHHGFRLQRLWIDRTLVTAGLGAATAGAAVAGAEGAGGVGVTLTVAAVAAVVGVGVVEIARTVAWAFRRRHLFRHEPRTEVGPVPDVLVARTGDAVVMNIAHHGPRPRVLDASAGDGDEASAPRLRLVGDRAGS